MSLEDVSRPNLSSTAISHRVVSISPSPGPSAHQPENHGVKPTMNETSETVNPNIFFLLAVVWL